MGKRLFSIILSAPVAIILLLLGIPGMVEDLATWMGWLSNGWAWLTQTPTTLSWVMVILGLVILFKPQRIFIKKQKGTTLIASQPERLLHDGVLWEDTRTWNSYYAAGPLCPEDYTPLAVMLDNRMNTKIEENYLIQKNGTQLICPECNKTYTLGESDKRIRESRSEATSRFDGIRRRGNRTSSI